MGGDGWGGGESGGGKGRVGEEGEGGESSGKGWVEARREKRGEDTASVRVGRKEGGTAKWRGRCASVGQMVEGKVMTDGQKEEGG